MERRGFKPLLFYFMLMKIKNTTYLVEVRGEWYTYLNHRNESFRISSEGDWYATTYRLSDMEPVTKLDNYLYGIDTEIEAAYNEGRKGESND